MSVAPAATPLTAATRLAAVIGDPVRHSLSPVLLNAAFATVGLDWAYLAFEVPRGGAGGAVAAMRTLGMGGMSVTMPHKAAVHDLVDARTSAAAALGAVNCVSWDGDRLVGDNTDGPGLVDALARRPGIDVAGRRCALVGAGGAARAVARALGQAGAAEVVVVNRSPGPAAQAAALAGPGGRVGRPADVATADLVVNATPVGMEGGGGGPGDVPVDPRLLRSEQVVVDLVYHPLETAFLRAARAAGAVPVDGLGMLVHQAAHAFERWTGCPPPVAAMEAAARTALAPRHPSAGDP